MMVRGRHEITCRINKIMSSVSLGVCIFCLVCPYHACICNTITVPKCSNETKTTTTTTYGREEGQSTQLRAPMRAALPQVRPPGLPLRCKLPTNGSLVSCLRSTPWHLGPACYLPPRMSNASEGSYVLALGTSKPRCAAASRISRIRLESVLRDRTQGESILEILRHRYNRLIDKRSCNLQPDSYHEELRAGLPS